MHPAKTANESLLFRPGHRHSRLPQGCVCGVALQEWRAFLNAACNVLAADRPTPGCFSVSFATLSPKALQNSRRKHVKLHPLRYYYCHTHIHLSQLKMLSALLPS